MSIRALTDNACLSHSMSHSIKHENACRSGRSLQSVMVKKRYGQRFLHFRATREVCCQVLNGELEPTFRKRHPGFWAVKDENSKKLLSLASPGFACSPSLYGPDSSLWTGLGWCPMSGCRSSWPLADSTFIASLRVGRLIASWCLDQTMTGETSTAYLLSQLRPTLKPGDIAICANLPAHKAAQVQGIIAAQDGSNQILASLQS
jgi:hypothetical protein